MELKDFIGKIVIRATDKKRLFITEITAPKIVAQTIEKDVYGHYTCYSWETINGDPITNGYLIFEDKSFRLKKLMMHIVAPKMPIGKITDIICVNREYHFKYMKEAIIYVSSLRRK